MSYVATYSGKSFDLKNPRPEDISIYDIAHALSMQCRFNGHTLHFYSVAEHCVRMSHMVSKEAALYGLLHDAAEAYMGDIVRPLKTEDLKALENNIMQVIAGLFLPLVDIEKGKKIFEEVKAADDRMLVTEATQIMSKNQIAEYFPGVKPYGFNLYCWGMYKAEVEFLDRFKKLIVKGEL